MSILREVPRHESIPGLRLKRRIGEKIIITHQGETLTLQIVRFESGFQVVVAFFSEADFTVLREELGALR